MCVYVREIERWKVRERCVCVCVSACVRVRERKYVVAQGCTYFGMNGLLKEEEMEL
jgi:hypothetical protein